MCLKVAMEIAAVVPKTLGEVEMLSCFPSFIHLQIIRKYRISTDQKELVVTLKTILEPTEPVRISFNKR